MAAKKAAATRAPRNRSRAAQQPAGATNAPELEPPAPPAAPAAPAAAPNVPSMDELIGGATQTTSSAPGGLSALDELVARLDQPTGQDGEQPAAAGDPQAGESQPGVSQDIPPRRGRGRPRKETPSVRDVERSTSKTALAARVLELEAQLAATQARSEVETIDRLAASVTMLAHVGFGLVAEWRGPKWKLDPEEANTLGKSTAQAAAPYAAELEATMPWAAPCLCLVGIIGKRIIQERQEVEQLALGV